MKIKLVNTADRAVSLNDVEAISRLVDQIGISGVLIACASACEKRGQLADDGGDPPIAEEWWENYDACTAASEQVSDP